METIYGLNDLEQKINSDDSTLFVLDFYADWCSPCRQMKHTISDIEEDGISNVQFLKIDIDENDEIRDHYMIRTIPTFIFIKDRFMLHKFSGSIGRNEFVKLLKKYASS